MSALATRFVTREHKLALGLEPIDALRGARTGAALRITGDRLPFQPALPQIERHDSGLHALRYQPNQTDPFDIRIFDCADRLYSSDSDRRRFVPRRLRVLVPTIAVAEQNPAANRVRRPALYAGAAYDVSENMTGLRGRVTRSALPLQWCRVEARVGATVVGRAHGDDRGEFLLLVDARSAGLGDLVVPFIVDVRIFGRAAASPLPSPEIISADPLWDLPLEPVPAPGLPDAVSAGVQLPTGYSQLASRNVELTLGLLRGGEPPFAV